MSSPTIHIIDTNSLTKERGVYADNNCSSTKIFVRLIDLI
jgi:hypothetical protein